MVGNTTGGCKPIYNIAYYKNVSDDVQGDEILVEFDDDGTHIRERGWGTQRRLLASDHTASFSRPVARLEERGYIERRPSPEQSDEIPGSRPTDQDGRYSLHFDTLDLDLDADD